MGSDTGCPAPGCLEELLAGTFSADEEHRLNQHVEGCPRCQEALHRLSSSPWDDAARHLVRELAPPEPGLRHLLTTLTRRSSLADPTFECGREDDLDDQRELERLSRAGRLGPYWLLEQVGRGGFGLVFKARDEKLDRIVAIKVLAPRLCASAAARQRFSREARAAAAVCHEHVVGIHAVEEYEGWPFIVMQYVAGVSLQERLQRSGPLEVKEILRIGRQTAEGLAAAHAQGLIHRDIKPSNILLENGIERVKITDFGLARAVDDTSLSQTGMVIGTPEYMAPEQARGEPVDHRADLFSLGSVLYALCTGRAPFPAPSTPAVLKRVCDEAPRPIRELNPDIPPWLVEIIGRLMAKEPAERFPSAAAVAGLLGRHLAHLHQPDSVPPPPPLRPRRSVTGRRTLVASACVAVAFGLLGWLWWPRDVGTRPGDGSKGSHANKVPLAVRSGPPRVLMILPSKDFFFPDYLTVHSILFAGGVEVKVGAARAEPAEPLPGNPKHVPVTPDVTLAEVKTADFDALYFCGGKGVDEFIGSGPHTAEARRLIREALAANRIVAALGTAPHVLLDAGVLRGVRATCFPWGQPPGIHLRQFKAAGATWVDEPVVMSGPIITGRGPADTLVFAEKLLEQLDAR